MEEKIKLPSSSFTTTIHPSPFIKYDETQYPRAAEESDETESGANTEEETPLILPPNVPSSHNIDPPQSLQIPSQTDQMANNGPSTEIEQPVQIEDKTRRESKEKEIMSCGICFQLLLDPITLNCGHSFCQVCLARLWTTSNNTVLLCPMCRQPWAESGGRLPSVNVIFREVLEHSYPEKIKERREALTQEEHNTIRLYTQGAGSVRPILPGLAGRRQFNINIMSCFLAIMICTVFSLVTSILLSILLMGGSSDHFMRKPVSHWNNDDVMEWIKGLGDTVQKDTKEIFEKEKIDGRHLVKLTTESLNEYGMSSELSRNSLLLSIDQLKESQFAPPRNFQEFMSANKEDAVLLLLTYKIFPRLTFGFVYIFHYYDIFLPVVQAQLHHDEVERKEEIVPLVKDEVQVDEKKEDVNNDEKVPVKDTKLDVKVDTFHSSDVTFTQLVAIFMEILLVPHLVVAMYAATGLTVVPALASVILLHCLVATLREVKDLRNKLRTRPIQGQTTFRSFVKTSIGSLVLYLFLLIVGEILCLILPPLGLDIIFYLLLFNIVYSMLYARFIRPLFQKIVRFGARILVQFMNA